MNNEKMKIEIAEKFRESGKSQRVWCAENGLKRSTLRYWLERSEVLSMGNEIGFAELVIAGEKE